MDSGFWILDLGSGVLDPRSRIFDTGSWMKDIGSCIQDSESRIQGPRSWISQQQKILLPKLEFANPQPLKFLNSSKCNYSLRHLFESGEVAQHSTGESKQMVESKRCNLQESKHKSGCNDLGGSKASGWRLGRKSSRMRPNENLFA